jgi:hypothetical protein
MIRQNPDVFRDIAMGYLNQIRQGQRSARRRLRDKFQARAVHQRDPSHIANDNEVFNNCSQVLTRAEFLNSSDTTGWFPIPTESGWEYIPVSTLSGYVHLEFLRERKAPAYLRAYKAMYAFYESRGKLPTTQRLDNETSGLLQAFLAEVKTKIEFMAPGIH